MSAWCLWVWGGAAVWTCRVHGAVRNTDVLTYLTGKATEEEIVSYVNLRPHRLNAQASKWVRKSAWCGQFAVSVTSNAPSATFLFSSLAYLARGRTHAPTHDVQEYYDCSTYYVQAQRWRILEKIRRGMDKDWRQITGDDNQGRFELVPEIEPEGEGDGEGKVIEDEVVEEEADEAELIEAVETEPDPAALVAEVVQVEVQLEGGGRGGSSEAKGSLQRKQARRLASNPTPTPNPNLTSSSLTLTLTLTLSRRGGRPLRLGRSGREARRAKSSITPSRSRRSRRWRRSNRSRMPTAWRRSRAWW